MLNIIAVMGCLVADPELRKTASGVSVTTFTIACDRSFAKAGEKRETDFLEVQAWRSSAEFACKYFRKGQLVAINGSLQTRTYEGREGQKRKVYEIVADNLHFADSKASYAGGGERMGPGGSAAPRALPQVPEAYSSGSADDFAVIDDSEDLPF